MNLIRRTVVAAVLGTVVLPLAAQETKPEPKQDAPEPTQEEVPRYVGKGATARPGQPAVPLEVRVVITQKKGEKTVKSAPYTFRLSSEPGSPSSIRLARKVRVQTGPGTWGYEHVGTNVDCRVSPAAGDRFPINVRLEADWLEPADAQGAGELFLPRNFKSQNNFILGDGESGSASATDPISGEVFVVEATLKRLK